MSMPEGAPDYPVSQVLNRLVQEYGPSPTGFIQRLGYRNIERGLRLQPWLAEGQGFGKIIKQIAAAYPAVAEELQFAITATESLKKAQAEAQWLEKCRSEADSFRPFVHVEGETRIPSSICIFGLTGGKWNRIELSDSILALPLEKQLTAVPELMLAYREKNNGICPFFRQITGFRLVLLMDYYRFDRNAVLTERVAEPFRTAMCYVGLRQRIGVC